MQTKVASSDTIMKNDAKPTTTQIRRNAEKACYSLVENSGVCKYAN